MSLHGTRHAGRCLVIAWAILVMTAIAPANRNIVFEDGEFLDWSDSHMGSTYMFAVMTWYESGGHPGAYITSVTYSSGGSNWVRHFMVDEGAAWDPGIDPTIESVRLEIDTKGIKTGGVGQGLLILIQQGGQNFLAAQTTTGSATSWHTMSLGPASPADFCLVQEGTWELDCDVHPDLSPGAEPMYFGFSTANNESPIIHHAYDNWRVEIEIDCPADIFADGIVDATDLVVLLSKWGPCPPEGKCPADLDDSGEVDVLDLLIVFGAWGPCP